MHSDGLVIKIVNPTALSPPSRSQTSTRTASKRLLRESTSTDSPNFPTQFTQEFRFDCSFWSSADSQETTQNSIYEELDVLAVQTVLQGQNCSVFAYGQTGTGKTYIMMGNNEGRTSTSASLTTSEQRGLIPRTCQGLFAEIDKSKRSDNTCTIVMSYVEIYDERVFDLLDQATTKKSLKVREHPENGVFVEHAQRVHVTSFTQVLELIEEGNRTRSVTSMKNSCRQTRSHTVLILSLTQWTTTSLEIPKNSKICMVDLAGSERADHGANGTHFREVASVNRSLTTLADVVGVLAKRRSNRSMDIPHPQKTFVPYRNSVLTRLLKECLGGRAKTIMIGSISPCCAHYEDSLATLRYIERARSLNNNRFQVDTTGGITNGFLNDINKLKSIFHASSKTSNPPATSNICCGHPEDNDEFLNCESCHLSSITGSITFRDTNEVTRCKRKSAFMEEVPGDFSDHERSAGQVVRESVILLKIFGIRRRWLALRQYRAFDQWRKVACQNATTSKEETEALSKGNESCNQTEPSQITGSKAGCPPLHPRIRSDETRSVERVHNVVETVVVTDAICCSVVQDFLFPIHHDSSRHPAQQSISADSASLLELLASSSEFDRSEFFCDVNENCGNNEPQLEELASPEDYELSSITNLDTTSWEEEKDPVHSALSLCVDSIDLARRALGPGMCKLLSRCPGSGAGVECELLRYLDKKFLMITRILEDLVATPRSHDKIPSRSTCETLESMLGEFCLQIITRLCGQLPSASSACIAGRIHLETQLDHFCDRLQRKFLPEIARGGDNPEVTTNIAFFVTTELLVMAERIKFVWSLAGYQKRERLLQTQASAIKDRNMTAKIAALEERNAELSATLLTKSDKFNEPSIDLNYHKHPNRIQYRDEDNPTITLTEFEREYDGDMVSKLHRNMETKLAEEVARNREVHTRNDELLHVCRIATLNHTLTTCTARMTVLEAENARLRSEIQPNLSANCVNSHVNTLQNELENVLKHVQYLEGQVVDLKRINWEQTSDLENAKELLLYEKETITEADEYVALLRRQMEQAKGENLLQTAAIEKLEMSLSKANAQREVAEMLAEDSISQHLQSDQIFEPETRICKDEQRLLELESIVTANVQERDEHIILLPKTEEASASGQSRVKELQDQLEELSKRELDELICVRGQLHEATLELASLREELTEMLDHSTLQSATIETLQLDQSESLAKIQDLEIERNELVLRCQSEQNDSEQKESAYQVFTQQSSEALATLERQHESEQQQIIALHETLQRQTHAFHELEARQYSIQVDYCSTIRDLKTQVATLSAETCELDQELTAKTIEMDAARTASEAQIQELNVQANIFRNYEESTRNAKDRLQECKLDFNASTSRWVLAEIQCGLWRVCAKRLDVNLAETKETCKMQLADTESSCSRYDMGVVTQAMTRTEIAVNEHLNSLDAWFDQVISGNQETIEVSSTSESINPAKTRDEDSAARSPLLKTLTDLDTLTNELLVVDTFDHSKNSPTEEVDPALRDANGKNELVLKSTDTPGPMLNIHENPESPSQARRKAKESDEVIQLRYVLMKTC
ncbi:hypothetical protein PHMEG_0005790 [Phytophthora megakarya]|uniref:Kinesin motor domain-containing protein n=1 Tax=Phytophthora megakarya TaxID=4795 RepID=A0A225WSE4_9STRA|nr:hypothetical protein PHMEG_0005790 [Phytophthora megakarya]